MIHLEMLWKRQRAADVDCVALVPGPNLHYVSGLRLFTSERPVVAFFSVGRRPIVLVPALEQGRAEKMAQGGVDFIAYTDEDGYTGAFDRAAELLQLNGRRVAVEQLHMRVFELWQLQAAAPGMHLVSLEDALPGLRIIKDEAEVAAMRQAVAMTEKALHELIAQPLIGLTEREIAGQLSRLMLDAGAEEVGFIIVVAGPNGADPHAGPSDRPVQAGELLTIDCGVLYHGYPSDITRTFALGNVSDELRKMYETVRQSNAAGRAATKAGIAAQEVDRAARQVIDNAGYGSYFVHRTGHGLGIEIHEPPYIVEGNGQLLEAGMVFTVEPGIYIPGLGGVRVEDNVVVTETGFDCLTTFPRELLVIS